MGLGVFGGGIASAKWLLQKGAQVTVTDMKREEELAVSLKKFTPAERTKIAFVLGEHREKDFLENDIIVVNPGVPKESRFLDIARKAGKALENDASFFYRFLENPGIGITGTRGKTTVTSWIAALLSVKYANVKPSGNTPDNALLKEITRLKEDHATPVVSELSSWQLELLPAGGKAPHIAIITNVFPDHLNRYKDIEEYARAKGNIFRHQTENDFLVLNYANEWTKFFLAPKPRSQVFYFSIKPLPRGKNGVFVKDGAIVFRRGVEERKIVDIKNFGEKMGEHNLENLLAAVLAVTLFDPRIRFTKQAISAVPTVPFRQEIIFNVKGLTVVNDSAGTSPDAVIAALRRFTNLAVRPPSEIVLITGGTDKKLEFATLAKTIKKSLRPKKLILLNGSATTKLIAELERIKFFKKTKPQVFETLDECMSAALNVLPKHRGTIVFSPGAASFEKFKNEFDRGEQFSKTVTSALKNRLS